MEKNKKIAITIPTLNREKELVRLLRSIAVQANLPKRYAFEILVINNNPISYWDRVVEAVSNSPFVMTCIDVRDRGFANVRNAAVSWVLKHDMDAMIFVDDDEIVPSGWLAAMIRAWEKYQGDIITGPVVPLLPSSVPNTLKMLHLLESPMGNVFGEKTAFANSGNTLVSKKVLEVMGPTFHSALNRSGGEDTLFFHQCHLRGFTIYSDDSTVVGEPTPPERTTLAYILGRWFNNGATRVTINKVLFPERWRLESYRLVLKSVINLLTGAASSIIRRDGRRFGRVLCRFAWMAGLFLCLSRGDTAEKQLI